MIPADCSAGPRLKNASSPSERPRSPQRQPVRQRPLRLPVPPVDPRGGVPRGSGSRKRVQSRDNPGSERGNFDQADSV